jgi:aspartyl-tRNA(Asn)/glutamyl-tRNA(Gln) amidotransferase subunit A
MKIDTKSLTIKKAHEHLKRGDFTVAELCGAYLKNIQEKNDEIHAFLEVFSDISEQAERAQKMFADGTATLLTGIPTAVKDNILIEGRRVGAASKILEGYVATYSGAAIQKLQAAGVVFMGRTNMDEFAMGSSTENSAYGPTKNPLDTSRVPGGSSGGAAAAIAMEGALISLGSDTAGSVRQPAGFCGCVGLKTTYGTISRSGLIALGSSLDQIGPVTKNVEDSEIVFNALCGQDPLDSTTLTDEQYKKAQADGAKKVTTIGVPRNLVGGEGIDADVLANFEESIERLKKLGYKIKDIELPHAKYSLPTYYIMLPGEASSNLARFDGMKYGLYMSGDHLIDDYLLSRGNGFGPEPRRRILLEVHTYFLLVTTTRTTTNPKKLANSSPRILPTLGKT